MTTTSGGRDFFLNMPVYFSVHIMYQTSWLNDFSRTLKTEIIKMKYIF